MADIMTRYAQPMQLSAVNFLTTGYRGIRGGVSWGSLRAAFLPR
jgi:hypothetical protein